MSERREKNRRWLKRIAYAQKFEFWLSCEPPMVLFWLWRAWLKDRPKLEE